MEKKRRVRLTINGVVCGVITAESGEYMQALADEVGGLMTEVQSLPSDREEKYCGLVSWRKVLKCYAFLLRESADGNCDAAPTIYLAYGR